MESFDYLSVLLSIILGLAITQVLLGFRGLILARVRVKIYLPTLIWAGLALLIAIQAWWASFGLRTRGTWNFLAFFVIALQTISVYWPRRSSCLTCRETPRSTCEITTLRIGAGFSVSCLPAWSPVLRKNWLSATICRVT
jgi:hypothetical protein